MTFYFFLFKRFLDPFRSREPASGYSSNVLPFAQKERRRDGWSFSRPSWNQYALYFQGVNVG